MYGISTQEGVFSGFYYSIPWEPAYTIFQDKKKFHWILQFVFIPSADGADQVLK